MTKKIFSLASLFVFLLISCKKEEPATAYYPPDYGDLEYAVKGLKDTSLEQTGKVSIPLYIERTAGKYEEVTLSVSDLPSGVTGSFTLNAAVPSYNTTLTFKSVRAELGKYPVTIKSISPGTPSKTYTIMLNVLPYSNPAFALDGKFTEARNCNQTGDSSYTVEITPIATEVNKVLMKGIWAGGSAYTVTALVNSTTHSVTLPLQNLNGLQFQGGGSYDDNQMQITYSVKDSAVGLVNDNCTSVFTRQ